MFAPGLQPYKSNFFGVHPLAIIIAQSKNPSRHSRFGEKHLFRRTSISNHYSAEEEPFTAQPDWGTFFKIL